MNFSRAKRAGLSSRLFFSSRHRVNPLGMTTSSLDQDLPHLTLKHIPRIRPQTIPKRPIMLQRPLPAASPQPGSSTAPHRRESSTPVHA